MLNHSFLKTKSRKSQIIYVKKSFLLLFIFFFVLSCGDEKVKISINKHTIPMIKEYMQEQEDTWNEGDLDSFMNHYWKSDSLQFIGKSGLNKGWQKTLDNYKKSYSNKEEMGTLNFNNKSIEIIGEETIFVIGEWYLERDTSLGDLEGMYSLIWQQKNGKWVITTDHSS